MPSPEAQAVLDRMTALTRAETRAIENFVDMLVAAGTWDSVIDIWSLSLNEYDRLTGWKEQTAAAVTDLMSRPGVGVTLQGEECGGRLFFPGEQSAAPSMEGLALAEQDFWFVCDEEMNWEVLNTAIEHFRDDVVPFAIAIEYVQDQSTSGTAASLQVTLPGVTPGNTIVVLVMEDEGLERRPYLVSDDQDGEYNLRVDRLSSAANNRYVAIFDQQQVTGGDTTITVSPTPSARFAFTAVEITNNDPEARWQVRIAQTSSFDNTAAAVHYGADVAGLAASPSEMSLAAFTQNATPNTVEPGPGYTAMYQSAVNPLGVSQYREWDVIDSGHRPQIQLGLASRTGPGVSILYTPGDVPPGSIGESDGVATVNGVGNLGNATGFAEGFATVLGVSEPATEGVGSSEGQATVAGAGNAVIGAVGSSAGVATVDGRAVPPPGNVGTSEGQATVAGVGAARVGASGQSQGEATVSGIGLAVGLMVGSSQGSATVDGRAVPPPGNVGTSEGQATVAGVGAAKAAAIGQSQGQATVSGVGDADGAMVGFSQGSATVDGVGDSDTSSLGLSAGAATVSGILVGYARGVGNSAGVATVVGVPDAVVADVVSLIDGKLRVPYGTGRLTTF